MAGDVRGTFDLNDRPATAAMRRLRREAEQLDLSMASLGKTVDSIFSEKNVAEVVNYERALARLDSQARRSFNSLGRQAKEAEFKVTRSIRGMDTSVYLLRDNLDRLSRTKATPKIDLDGVTKAVAGVELLQKRLHALSRETATPRVGIPQSALAAGAVSRVGGGGGGFGSLKVPFAGAVPYPLVAGALGAAPPFLGATVATAGSLGAATLGAGSIGLGAAGTGAAALGMSIPIAISSISGIKEASKALEAYRQEVIKSGVNSEAARQKYRLYNMALEAGPAGTGRLLRAKEGLSEDFRSSTKPAQAGFTGILTRGLNLGRQLTPLYSRQANQFFETAQPQFGQYADFLNSGSSRQFYEAVGGEAAKSLRPTENIVENITGTMMNLTRSARPFFREGLHFLDRWTGGWRRSTHDIHGVREDMRGWVGDLKEWGKLTKATFELLGDLGSAGRGSGRSLVGDLTTQLEVWDRWVERNPRQVRSFFRESVDSTERLAEAVGRITNLIFRIGQMLTPILRELSQFVTFADNAGLLSPGMLPLLIAGGAGVRNVMGGARGRILGTAGGGVAGGTAAEGLALGAAVGGGAAGPGLFSRLGAFGSRVMAGGRVPAGMMSVGDIEAMGLRAPFSARAAAGAAGSEVLGAAGTAGGTFLRGFGARFLPIAALLGGLQFASFPGSFGQRTQAAASGLTAGYIPMPKTGAEETDQGNQAAQEVASHYARRFGGATPRQIQEQISAIRRKRRGLLHTEQTQAGFTLLETVPAALGLIHGSEGPSDTERAEAAALGKQLQSLRNERVQQASQGAIEDVTGAYEVRSRHGVDPKDNYERTISTIERRVQKMHGRTRKQFAQLGLDWANELAKANPKLKQAYEQMAEQMENRLRKAGGEIKVINGRIVDISASSWDKVAEQISTSTQRAYSEANEHFTALEQRAFAILRQMGYSKHDAKSLVHEAQTGRPTKQHSQEASEARHHGMQHPPTVNQIGGFERGNASGGRLIGQRGDYHDNIYLGNGQWAAGNELMVNQHTERRINRLLGGTTTLGREVAMENRAHSQMPRAGFATGGRGRGITAAATLAERMHMGISGGPGHGGIPTSGHASDSLHYQGLAYDITGSAAQMRRYFFAAARDFRSSINELFYDPIGWYLDQGHKVAGAIGGHSDHVHIGFFPGGARLAPGMRGLAGARAGRVRLQAPGSRLSGIPGAASELAGQMAASGMSRRLNALIGAGRGGGGGGIGHGGGTPQQNMMLARSLLGRFGWGGDQWGDLKSLWTQESGWRTTARNPSSGAYGIPQALPASKMGPEAQGSGPAAARAQILWGLRYIRDRYGSPSGAWEHEQRNNWYSRGGRLRGFAGWYGEGGRGRVHGPTLIGLGENGPEDFEITPTPKRGRAGGRGGGGAPVVHIRMGNVTIRGSADAEKTGKEIGRHAARELTKALQESDGVREEELIGG